RYSGTNARARGRAAGVCARRLSRCLRRLERPDVLLHCGYEEVGERALRERVVRVRLDERSSVLAIRRDLDCGQRPEAVFELLVRCELASIDEALWWDVIRHVGSPAEDRNSPDQDGIEDLLVDPAIQLHVLVAD